MHWSFVFSFVTCSSYIHLSLHECYAVARQGTGIGCVYYVVLHQRLLVKRKKNQNNQLYFSCGYQLYMVFFFFLLRVGIYGLDLDFGLQINPQQNPRCRRGDGQCSQKCLLLFQKVCGPKGIFLKKRRENSQKLGILEERVESVQACTT